MYFLCLFKRTSNDIVAYLSIRDLKKFGDYQTTSISTIEVDQLRMKLKPQDIAFENIYRGCRETIELENKMNFENRYY